MGVVLMEVSWTQELALFKLTGNLSGACVVRPWLGERQFVLGPTEGLGCWGCLNLQGRFVCEECVWMIDGPLHFSGCTPLWGLDGLAAGGWGAPSLAYCSLGRVPHDEPHIPFLLTGTRGSDRVPSEATGRWGVLAGL